MHKPTLDMSAPKILRSKVVGEKLARKAVSYMTPRQAASPRVKPEGQERRHKGSTVVGDAMRETVERARLAYMLQWLAQCVEDGSMSESTARARADELLAAAGVEAAKPTKAKSKPVVVDAVRPAVLVAPARAAAAMVVNSDKWETKA